MIDMHGDVVKIDIELEALLHSLSTLEELRDYLVEKHADNLPDIVNDIGTATEVMQAFWLMAFEDADLEVRNE